MCANSNRPYETIPCKILASDIISNKGSRATTYNVEIKYTYSVRGQTYNSKRYTYDSFGGEDSDWARQAIRFPAGSQRTCYYDPRHPERVVLLRGLQGENIFMPMFLTPFNIIACVWIWVVVGEFYFRSHDPKPDAVDTFQNREIWRMSDFTPLTTFAAVLAMTSFLGVFICAIPSGFHPSLQYASLVWSSCFLLAAIVGLITRGKTKAGKYDLILDLNNRTLTVPPMHKRSAPISLPFREVQSIQPIATMEGTGRGRHAVLRLHLFTRDGRDFILKDEPIQSRGERMAKVLSRRIGLSNS